MEYGRTYTYRDKKDAEKLIGKRVIASSILGYIEELPGASTEGELVSIDEKDLYSPYRVYVVEYGDRDDEDSYGEYQFIREIDEGEHWE